MPDFVAFFDDFALPSGIRGPPDPARLCGARTARSRRRSTSDSVEEPTTKLTEMSTAER